jgi:lysophospholipase L1-like esterase
VRRFLVPIVKSFVTTVIFFALAETTLRGAYIVRNALVHLVPLPYALGDEYGPMPPWLDRLLILVPDDTLIWRSLPRAERTYVDIFSPVRREQDRIALLRRFLPSLPPEFRDNPTWHIALNSEGYRTSEFATVKPPQTIRIACIGDSWTFGMNVDQDRTYPSRLGARLRETRPDLRPEVLNFGVLGYSSFQGLQQLKARVADLRPDVLAIGFGMNDSEVAGYRDKDMTTSPRPRLATRVRETAADLEFYKLLNYVALAARFHPKPLSDYLRAEAESKSDAVDYDAIEPWTRVSPRDYDRNIREMVRLQTDRGGRVVLVDNELWDQSPYRPVLRKIAAEAHVPLVDSVQIVADARRAVEREVEERLGLAAAGPKGPALPGAGDGRTTVVLRVHRGTFPVSKALSIVGTAPELGNLAPNAALMHDDGTGGDEHAGDGVWSLAASFPAGTRLFYMYTNSGARGSWEGLDVPTIRHVTVPAAAAGETVYLPIETFGRIYMQADNWHTDAMGYDLIARAVADAIARRP